MVTMCGYFGYSEGDFEVFFAPQGQLVAPTGLNLVWEVYPFGVGVVCEIPKKLKMLPISEYKRPTGVYPFGDF